MSTSRVLVVFAMVACMIPVESTAYVQTMTCDESGKYKCNEGEIPKAVRWPSRCITYYVNEVGTSDLSDHNALVAAIASAFRTWNEIQGAEINLYYAGMTNEDRAEHIDARGPEGNANVILFRDDNWTHSSKTAFAITSVTFDPSDGLIADADIELNTQHHEFTINEPGIIVDVANTVTHEVGHFIGLDHTNVAEATMFGVAPQGETQKRSLHVDDISGFMATYPSAGLDTSCGDVPNYFDAPPDVGTKKGCCATTGPSRNVPLVALALAIFGLLARRKRR